MSCSTDRLEPTRTVWRRSARWSVAWASARGPVATLGLEGYRQALPAAHRPSAREVVGRLDVNDGE
jgi:hypothetical protein